MSRNFFNTIFFLTIITSTLVSCSAKNTTTQPNDSLPQPLMAQLDSTAHFYVYHPDVYHIDLVCGEWFGLQPFIAAGLHGRKHGGSGQCNQHMFERSFHILVVFRLQREVDSEIERPDAIEWIALAFRVTHGPFRKHERVTYAGREAGTCECAFLEPVLGQGIGDGDVLYAEEIPSDIVVADIDS